MACVFGSGSRALEASIAAVSKYGRAERGYRTMLDALIPASIVLKEASDSFLSHLLRMDD